MKIRKAIAAQTEPAFTISGLDATPERMAKGESDVVQALIDRAGERPGNARKFRASHLDRLHKSGSINYYQWYAGDWYREKHARCQFPLSVVASYGERSGAGEYPGNFGYGLPRQEAQARAREELRKAREQFPREMIGFMDRFLIHDSMPRYGGRAAMRNLAQIRRALDTLAGYLQFPIRPAPTHYGRSPVEIICEAQADLMRVIGVDMANGPDETSISIYGDGEPLHAPMDPAFLDERGLMLPAAEIAAIIRARVAEKNDG